MKANVHIDLQKVYVLPTIVGLPETEPLQMGYWYGITSITGRVVGCHVTLETGANWTRIPISALRWHSKAKKSLDSSGIQPWDCFSYFVEYTRFPFLRDMRVQLLDRKQHDATSTGRYLFTLDWLDPDGEGPFAEFPEQHKQGHVIAVDDGTIRVRPNNMLRWQDKALFELDKPLPRYHAIDKVYRGEI